MAKVVAYQVEVNGLKTAITNQEDLAAAVRETTKAYKSADFGSEKFRQSEKELAQLRTLQAKFREDVKQTAREQEVAADKGRGSYRSLNAELVNLRRRYKELSAEERDAFGPDLLNRIQKLDKELKEIDADMGQFQRNVGNYSGGIRDAFAQLGGLDLAALATVPGAIVAVGSAAIDTAKFVFDLTEEFRKLRGEIQNLTGATGADLDEFTVRIFAIGETFDESTTEILSAANAVSKQLDIPFTEALDRIEEGFIAGSNQSGEFLDNLREYPAFFNEAGLGADALFRIINQQAKEGLFSDKGVDAVKEVTLRLREMTKSTTDALTGIGLDSEQVKKQIEDDGIGAAIATISERLGTLRADSPEVGTAIADIFGGAGEDAGLAFLLSLKDINQETGSLIDQTNEYQVQQQKTLQVNKEFAAVQNEVAKEVGGAGAQFENLGTIIQTKALKFLLFFIEQLKFLGSIFRPLVDAFTPLLRSLGGFSDDASAADVVVRSLAKGFEIVTYPVRLAVNLIAGFVNGLRDAIDTGRGFLEWLGILDKQAQKTGGGIKTLPGAMDGFGKKTKEATETQKEQQKVIESNITTIEGLKQKLQELKDQRDRTEIGSKEFQELDQQILALEKNLKRYGSESQRAAVVTDAFAKGSVAGLREEVSKLKKELEEAAPEKADGVLVKLIGAEKALEEVEKAREELRNKIVSGNRSVPLLDDRVTLLDPDLVKQQGERYKKDFEIISKDLTKKQVEAQKKAAEETLKIQQQNAAAIKEIQQEIFSGIGDVLDNLGDASRLRYENEEKALEARYEREIALAGNNTARQAQLERELDAERERLQERQLEDQKKYRIAAARASFFEGVINTLSSPTTIPDPFGAIYKAARITLLKITTDQQIANINAQTGAEGLLVEMARGGILRGAAHSDPSGGIPLIIHGQRVLAEHGEDIQRDEFGGVAVINKRSTARYRRELERVRGRIFPGKRKYLSDINSARSYGVAFAAEGALLQPEVASVISGRSGGATATGGDIRIDVDSINLIATATAQAVYRGAREGTASGSGDATRRRDREARLSKRTGI